MTENQPQIDTPEAFAAAFDVSRETLARLQLYADLLVTWQSKINLVAPTSLATLWHRHMADSAQLTGLAPLDATRWVDLGSGAGFPGLVAAILWADKPCRFTLVESDSRKAAFLREVARQTKVSVDIVNARIELSTIQAMLTGAEIYSARALAPFDRLLAYSAPLFSASSTGLFLKGQQFSSERAKAEQLWTFDVQLVDSVTDPAAQIVIVRNIHARTSG